MKKIFTIFTVVGTIVLAGAVAFPSQSNALSMNFRNNADAKVVLQDDDRLPLGIRIASGIEKRIENGKGFPLGIISRWLNNDHDNDNDDDEDQDENVAIRFGRLNIDVDDSSANISFRTNVETRGEIEYSKVATLRNSEKVALALNTEHSVKLEGLSADSTYYLKITLEDKDGDKKFESQIRSFTTDKEADVDVQKPRIGFLHFFNVEQESASVIWVTNEPTNGSVWISEDAGVDTTVTADYKNNNLAHFHVFNLTNLSADTEYHVVVASADASGNTSYSAEISFMTDEDD